MLLNVTIYVTYREQQSCLFFRQIVQSLCIRWLWVAPVVNTQFSQSVYFTIYTYVYPTRGPCLPPLICADCAWLRHLLSYSRQRMTQAMDRKLLNYWNAWHFYQIGNAYAMNWRHIRRHRMARLQKRRENNTGDAYFAAPYPPINAAPNANETGTRATDQCEHRPWTEWEHPGNKA